MKSSNKKIKLLKSVFLALLLPALLLPICCGKETPAPPVAPFSEASWQYTLEDVLSYEGEGYTTYDSVYGGTCYTYPKIYQERQGTIKYMFDGEERLMCVAWTCAADEEQELYDFYSQIEESVDAITNEDKPDPDKPLTSGRVWYREEGNIILSLMITSDLKVLQYGYLHPDVSSPPKE